MAIGKRARATVGSPVKGTGLVWVTCGSDDAGAVGAVGAAAAGGFGANAGGFGGGFGAPAAGSAMVGWLPGAVRGGAGSVVVSSFLQELGDEERKKSKSRQYE